MPKKVEATMNLSEGIHDMFPSESLQNYFEHNTMITDSFWSSFNEKWSNLQWHW